MLSKTVMEYNELNKACEDAAEEKEADVSKPATMVNEPEEDEDGDKSGTKITLDLDGDGIEEELELDSCLANKCKYLSIYAC